MWNVYHKVMRYCDQFDLQDWFMVLIVVLACGALCLRGFGSRTGY
jgi:hypothetical protein